MKNYLKKFRKKREEKKQKKREELGQQKKWEKRYEIDQYNRLPQILKDYLDERRGVENWKTKEKKYDLNELEKYISIFAGTVYRDLEYVTLSEDKTVIKIKKCNADDIAFFAKRGYKIQGTHKDQRWNYGANIMYSTETEYCIMIKDESKE